MEWKWTLGEPYERSRRPDKNDLDRNYLPDEHFSQEIEQTAYTRSLHHDENTWDLLNQHIYHSPPPGFRDSNKREELDDKMAHRDLIQQVGVNPFLSQTNYVDDMAIRDQYLKPINTSQDKIKTESANTE
jgi:hypothetical protein